MMNDERIKEIILSPLPHTIAQWSNPPNSKVHPQKKDLEGLFFVLIVCKRLKYRTGYDCMVWNLV
jgi:hypothetical protein